jgi:drug/metabolite transporter (DMT)-like permease
LGIILGLIGAVSWGIADFWARFASRRIGAYRTLFFVQAIGFVVLSAYMKFTGGFGHRIAPGWQPWALAAVAGVLNVIGSLALYYSFQVGVMSVVAPVSTSYPALTIALALASGERIHAIRGAGLAVTLLGVILASTSFAPEATQASTDAGASPHAHLTKGVGWAIVAALGFGFLFWFLGFHVVPAVGSVVSVWVIRVTSFSALALVAAPARQSLRFPGGGVWWLLVGIGVLDTAAFVAGSAGLAIGPISVVTVLVSLYGAVTVLLAWVFLRERLERSQWLGVALIFAGLVLVSH